MELNIINSKIINCLNKLYTEDKILFLRNKEQGLCERCLVFRFAHYLQDEFEEYFVDCDFNSSSINGTERSQKTIRNQNGSGSKKRFIDIIVHKRTLNSNDDFICFEIKKWNNQKKKDFKKDENNLKILTSDYGYKYGFHLIFGKNQDETKLDIWQNGQKMR